METESQSVIVVVCAVPDEGLAGEIARDLLEKRLAACVNVSARSMSHYRWQGKIVSDQEVILMIKTRAGQYAQVQAAIVALHPYDTPEIIALPLVDGLPAYLDWVRTETGNEEHP
ncbi:divalent-cation tolerance protein CutA [Burkholderiaceae bacterium DAT-1]|nr:divalent-cation tolerance protein CutA [Burkholderiaceae bacterium DAT-1]